MWSSCPHALVGARLAQGRSPLAALVSGVASHYLLDQVPHLDYDHHSPAGKTIVALELAVVACSLAAAKRLDAASLTGACGGLLPDIVAVLAPTSPATRLHERVHTPFKASPAVNVLLQTSVAFWGWRGLRSARP